MSLQQSKQILVAARALLSDPVRWTRGELARDKFGHGTDSQDPDAVCYCAYGALMKVCPDVTLCDRALEHLTWLTQRDHNQFLGDFNDRHTHEEVLSLFDTAIARIK